MHSWKGTDKCVKCGMTRKAYPDEYSRSGFTYVYRMNRRIVHSDDLSGLRTPKCQGDRDNGIRTSDTA